MQQAQWDGRSKGNIAGYRFFVFLIRTGGLSLAYFFLNFVAFYFFLVSGRAKFIRNYFITAHAYSKVKARLQVFVNFKLLGQILIDKIALLSGNDNGKISIVFEGHEKLVQVAKEGKGCLLISAHIGNTEIAGHKLNLLETPFHILVYENEATALKNFLDRVMSGRKISFIVMKENDLGFIIELKKAFDNNEFVVMLADRYRPGSPVLNHKFFGREAKFPKGPFILAAKFGVPVIYTYATKSGRFNYHFFAYDPIYKQKSGNWEDDEQYIHFLAQKYVHSLEETLRKYPNQWFNYFDFWAKN